jgi:hypothetical protein
MGAPFNNNTFSLAFAVSSINGAFSVRTVNGTGNLTAQDNIVYVDNTSGAAMTLTPPASPAVDQVLIIKDIAGNAATYNITFEGTVDGVTDPVIGSNYGGVFLTWNGVTWSQHA